MLGEWLDSTCIMFGECLNNCWGVLGEWLEIVWMMCFVVLFFRWKVVG